MVDKGDYVSWRTDKGRYIGQVSSIQTSGRVAVVTSTGGTETIGASADLPVARAVVYVNNQDGTYSRSDRTVAVRVGMLRVVKKPETKAVSAAVSKTLAAKAKEHNEKVGNVASKRTTTRTLTAVFERGVGAYTSNPGSVRPTVNSPEQWAYARVNSFLYALRNGRFRGGSHDTDLLPKGHPRSSKGIDADTDELDDIDDDVQTKKTNFPSRGDDQKVSIANSQFKVFPRAEAERLRTEWPQIWRKGGNILGNTQYRRLTKVMNQGGSAKTPTDEKAIRLREAWSARHFRDFRLAGVVAQIKWLMVGSRGLSHMRKVISDEKKRLNARKALEEEE
jgi:hypothetical protein